MKTVLLGIAIVGLASSAFASLDRTELDNRIQQMTDKFNAMQQNPSTRVPADQLKQAQGIILLDRTSGALIFGFHGGNGVALARDDSGKWSPAGFVSSGGASLGLQAGGGKDFYVMLLMDKSVAQALKESVMDFGAQASATGGSEHAGGQATVNSGPAVVVYSEHNGVYAGASIKGGSISADTDANAVYYGRPISMTGILFDREVASTRSNDALIAKLNENSK